MSSSIRLSSVAAGDGGTVFVGVFVGEVTAYPAPAGDVTGDGIDDFLIGTDSYFGLDRGLAYIIFGGQSFTVPVPLVQAKDEVPAFKIAGGSLATTWHARSAGDVNGDGRQDVIVATPGDAAGGPGAGAAFVVFGKSSIDTVVLPDIGVTVGGFRISGALPGGAIGNGQTVTGIGDVNGDGLADLLVGAPGSGASPGPGAAHVVFGKADNAAVRLADVGGGTGGFRIVAEAATIGLGAATAPLGDLNGDGIGDFGLVSGGDAAGQGAFAYVIHGRAGAQTDVQLAQVALGQGGFRVTPQAGDVFFRGGGIQAAGDVNGDGIGDLLLGVATNDAGGTDAGAAYVVFGRAGGVGPVHLDDIAAGQGGFRIRGESAGSRLGSAWSLGDVNGDGRADLLLGAPGADGGDGAAYVVYGKADTAEVDLAAVAAGQGGFKMLGHDGLNLGLAVAPLGDLNGDGLQEVGIGTALYLGGRGALYMLDGEMFATAAPLSRTGTAAGETLQGGSRNDTLRGLDGNDTLPGRQGDDSLEGGNGDDRLDGGTGNDTLAGGAGNDSYVVDRPTDLVIEAPGGGIDTVFSSLRWTLGAEVENLVLTGRLPVRGNGNALDNALSGNDAANALYGLGGNDTVSGFGGADLLSGGDGRDILRGGTGNDRLEGGAGVDRLAGGRGDDTLTGGAGVDTFLFTGRVGLDVVTDFTPGQDRLLLRGLGFADAAAVLAATADTGAGARIALPGGPGEGILLAGLAKAQLLAGDILL